MYCGCTVGTVHHSASQYMAVNPQYTYSTPTVHPQCTHSTSQFTCRTPAVHHRTPAIVAVHLQYITVHPHYITERPQYIAVHLQYAHSTPTVHPHTHTVHPQRITVHHSAVHHSTSHCTTLCHGTSQHIMVRPTVHPQYIARYIVVQHSPPQYTRMVHPNLKCSNHPLPL